MCSERVVSGMRPTGSLHVGHYHGVLKNWLVLQAKYACFFFVADWHALSTNSPCQEELERDTWEIIVDWLACGVNPEQATIFIQSKVPEHAELFSLLAMMTPVGWLERVPSYKDRTRNQINPSTYGFLGYPLMQAADVLMYRANLVPVGEDQVPHIEVAREIARRFNRLFGSGVDFQKQAKIAIEQLTVEDAALYRNLRIRYQEHGDFSALDGGRDLLNCLSLSRQDFELLYGYLEGPQKVILNEPKALVTEIPRLIGLDGRKMSKSFDNFILIREESKALIKKVTKMRTDPARMRLKDPGTPENCPVWFLHQVYSDAPVKLAIQDDCRNATIGCLDCKNLLIQGIENEVAPIREQGKKYQKNKGLLQEIVSDGCERARMVARDTMREVREAMGLIV